MRRLAAVCGAALTLAGLDAPTAAAQTSGCTLAPTGGTIERTLGDRSYRISVPAGLDGTAVPLLLSLHGFGSSAGQDETFTGWTPFASSNGFIVAYPQGRPTQFSGAWDPYTVQSPDVDFLRSVVADIAARWCVDPHRIHVDGWSNGAVMSQRTACAAADLFASVSSYGGGTPTGAGFAAPCVPSRPVSVALVVGRYDFVYPGLAQNTQEWRAINGCTASPERTTDQYGSTDTYACAGGAEVLARTVADTSHNWPAGAKGEDQRRRLWAFFASHPKP